MKNIFVNNHLKSAQKNICIENKTKQNKTSNENPGLILTYDAIKPDTRLENMSGRGLYSLRS